VIITGKSFSRGHIKELDVNDILVVKDDCESHMLLGKRALIVASNVEFSHILALARSMNIPALYGTGDIKLPHTGKLSFNTTNKIAWVEQYHTVQ
jgi:phosphoenolpyruvate-protein kinase (PTS system EI component)